VTAPLPVADVAHLTGIPASTIRRWLSEDRLCRLTVHGRSCVRLTEVLEVAELLSHDVDLTRDT
jgi:hypothetical protein